MGGLRVFLTGPATLLVVALTAVLFAVKRFGGDGERRRNAADSQDGRKSRASRRIMGLVAGMIVVAPVGWVVTGHMATAKCDGAGAGGGGFAVGEAEGWSWVPLTDSLVPIGVECRIEREHGVVEELVVPLF